MTCRSLVLVMVMVLLGGAAHADSKEYVVHFRPGEEPAAGGGSWLGFPSRTTPGAADRESFLVAIPDGRLLEALRAPGVTKIGESSSALGLFPWNCPTERILSDQFEVTLTGGPEALDRLEHLDGVRVIAGPFMDSTVVVRMAPAMLAPLLRTGLVKTVAGRCAAIVKRCAHLASKRVAVQLSPLFERTPPLGREAKYKALAQEYKLRSPTSDGYVFTAVARDSDVAKMAYDARIAELTFDCVEPKSKLVARCGAASDGDTVVMLVQASPDRTRRALDAGRTAVGRSFRLQGSGPGAGIQSPHPAGEPGGLAKRLASLSRRNRLPRYVSVRLGLRALRLR